MTTPAPQTSAFETLGDQISSEGKPVARDLVTSILEHEGLGDPASKGGVAIRAADHRQLSPVPMCRLERRRALITACGLVAALPGARGQPTRAPYRVALVFTTTRVADMAGPEPTHPGVRMFLETLRASGYDARNLVYEPRSAEADYARYAEIFADLAQLKTDVIVTVGDDMTRAAQQATSTIPIVMAFSTAPVEAGVVQSLARPGGNVTGLMTNPAPELEAKRLQLLKEAVPAIKRVAFLGLQSEWEDRLARSVRAAAPGLGIALSWAESRPNDYATAFAEISRNRPDAVFVAHSPVNFGHRNAIVESIAKARLPAIYSAEEFVLIGGLMSYGTNVPDLFRRAALVVVKLLKGAKPADLPVEQPTKFDMIVNLKTAKELELRIPQEVLLRADRVIQ
jgi:putative ABC transport system substrate-binding protein